MDKVTALPSQSILLQETSWFYRFLKKSHPLHAVAVVPRREGGVKMGEIRIFCLGGSCPYLLISDAEANRKNGYNAICTAVDALQCFAHN